MKYFVFFVLQTAASFFTIEVTIRVGGSWIGSLRRTRDKQRVRVVM